MTAYTAQNLIWGGLTNTTYERMVKAMHGLVAAELRADVEAVASGMSGTELEAARSRVVEVVQGGHNLYRSPVWDVKGGFLACAGHDLVS